MNEIEISIELSHSLGEWALLPSSGGDKTHERFRAGAIIVAREYFRARIDSSSIIASFQALRNDKFPACDISKSFEHCLRYEEATSPIFCYEQQDKKGINMEAIAPKYRWYNTQTRQIEYKLKPKFRGIPFPDLDPFSRFHFEEISKPELFFTKWIVDNNDRNNTEIGEKLMKSYLYLLALQDDELGCFHCKRKKSLRWNGRSKASWHDLVCIECNAMYMIKTKSNMNAVEAAFRFNKISGGSFEEFCKLHNSLELPKMFLVLLPRKSIVNDAGNKVYPVYIAEILSGVPQLYHGAFNKNLPLLRLKTHISVDLFTKKRWFDLPMQDMSVDIGAIAKRVLIERFSMKTFRALETLYFEDHEEEEDVDD